MDLTKKYTKKQCQDIDANFKENIMNDVAKRIECLELYKATAEAEDKALKDTVSQGFGHIELAIKDLAEQNKLSHDEIIKHQKHTNGDVSQLKVWRAGLAGGLAVILACGGFVSTFYFMERADQHKKNETVIRMEQQLSVLNEKLKELELTQ